MKAQQRQRICKDFLRMQHGAALDAMQASAMMRKVWGIKIDHHEFTDALEYLVQNQEATRTGTGPDRFTTYLIN